MNLPSRDVRSQKPLFILLTCHMYSGVSPWSAFQPHGGIFSCLSCLFFSGPLVHHTVHGLVTLLVTIPYNGRESRHSASIWVFFLRAQFPHLMTSRKIWIGSSLVSRCLDLYEPWGGDPIQPGPACQMSLLYSPLLPAWVEPHYWKMGQANIYTCWHVRPSRTSFDP